MICPICNVEMARQLYTNGSWNCIECGRSWYETGNPDTPLVSQRRRVKVVAPLVPGAKLSDCIKPVTESRCPLCDMPATHKEGKAYCPNCGNVAIDDTFPITEFGKLREEIVRKVCKVVACADATTLYDIATYVLSDPEHDSELQKLYEIIDKSD